MEARQISDPGKLNDVGAVRRLLDNAVRLKRDDVAFACRRRIYELSGRDYSDPIERRLWEAISAYEETLRDKHGRNLKASYTRRKIAKKGVIQTLTDWAMDPDLTPGFLALFRNGAAKFTGEYIVIEFADHFPKEAAEMARKKLQDNEVDLSSVGLNSIE